MNCAISKILEWIEDNKEMATNLINNAISAATRRDKIKKINDAERKKIGKGAAPLAGKIAVCTIKDSNLQNLLWWRETPLVEAQNKPGIEGFKL